MCSEHEELLLGTPTTVQCEGASLRTTAPAPTIDSWPTEAPGSTTEPIPTCASWPTLTPPPRTTRGEICTCAPILQSCSNIAPLLIMQLFADYRAGIDNNSGHHYRSSSDTGRRRSDGSRVDKSRGQKPVFQRAAKTPRSTRLSPTATMKAARRSNVPRRDRQDWPIAKRETGSRRVIVHEHDTFETSCATGLYPERLFHVPQRPRSAKGQLMLPANLWGAHEFLMVACPSG